MWYKEEEAIEKLESNLNKLGGISAGLSETGDKI